MTRPGCPNTPPCGHARIAHDVEDADDPLPMCCVDGCGCGHDRTQLPGSTPTPDTAAPLVPEEAWQAAEALYRAHGVDFGDFERTAISVAFSAALAARSTAESGDPT